LISIYLDEMKAISDEMFASTADTESAMRKDCETLPDYQKKLCALAAHAAHPVQPAALILRRHRHAVARHGKALAAHIRRDWSRSGTVGKRRVISIAPVEMQSSSHGQS